MANNADWRSAARRTQMVQTIEAHLRKIGTPVSLAQLTNYENGIFQSANTSQDEYRQKLSKLIRHLQSAPVRGKIQQMGAKAPVSTAQQPMFNATQGQGEPVHPPLSQEMPMTSSMSLHQLPGSAVQQQLVTNNQMIGQQGGQPGQQGGQPMASTQMMPNSTGFIPDSSFAPSPAPSQPQIPPQPANFPTRPAYSPGPGMPMPSPTQGVMRAPHPSPSMNMNINTPAPAMTPQDPQAPSPASLITQSAPQTTPGGGTEEDQLYMEKVRELTTYIEPLKRMLSKMNKEGRTSGADYNKLCVLLNLLQPSNNKTSYDMLCRCEDVLKKLKLPSIKPSKDSMPDSNSHWCQPLLTAVTSSMNASANCKNALRQTFGPAMHVFYGPNYSSSVPQFGVKRKRKFSGSTPAAKKPAVPHLIQGELARLDKKFKVCRDKASENLDGCDDGQGLRLQCTLDDRGLPSVPPIKFSVPETYPDTSPFCDMEMELYETSDFFMDIKFKFLNSLKKLQNKHSITALLETWLVSVKQTGANLGAETTNAVGPLAVKE
ncbi:mediator of RNA polymerase II transcription subunit 15-like [Watersipora subatra]|uniref:mediator of RNA polymerase II transcription subunit 15-like n=1 Tax=Watersipora subatra TaxID=2589382 RepID=UPI00355B63F6